MDECVLYINFSVLIFSLQEGNTPLLVATVAGHTDMISYLIENNANLNVQNYYVSPHKHACPRLAKTKND